MIKVSLKANRLSFIFFALFYLPDCSGISVMRHNTFTAFLMNLSYFPVKIYECRENKINLLFAKL